MSRDRATRALPHLLALTWVPVVIYSCRRVGDGEHAAWVCLRFSLLPAIVAFFPFDALHFVGIRAAFWSLELAWVMTTVALACVVQTAWARFGVFAGDVWARVAASYVCEVAAGLMFARLYLALDETNVRVGGLFALGS